MKVAIIGTAGLPAKYGGFETLAEYLTKELNQKHLFLVYCSSKMYSRKLSQYNGSNLKHIPLNANGAQSILYDIVSMIHALFFADVILILGVSGCIFLPVLRLLFHKKIIVNIDGLEWQREKWSRFGKSFLKMSEVMAVRFATDVVTDNKKISDYVKQGYGIESTLIPYGADHVNHEPITQNTYEQYPFLKTPYIFKVCRIEPENNISMILEAFAELSKTLVIVGNWKNSEYGITLKKKYEKFPHIHLLEPIYNQKILNQLRSNCTLYVHGHSAGGTNPSLVEAMYLGLPIVAYSVGYNKETTFNSAVYFHNKEDLVDVVTNISEDTLIGIGEKMKKLAQAHYRWSIIAAQYDALFSNGNNSKP